MSIDAWDAKPFPCCIHMIHEPVNTIEELDRALFRQSAIAVARQLLGLYLVHETRSGTTVGKIVETEAYCQDDPAAHTYRGMTARNKAMFGPAGHAYIYHMHGHHCVNCTAGPDGYGAGCLLRALESVAGIDLMQKRRGVEDEPALCSGPGKLAQAMGITMAQYGSDLLDAGSPLRLERPQSAENSKLCKPHESAFPGRSTSNGAFISREIRMYPGNS